MAAVVKGNAVGQLLGRKLYSKLDPFASALETKVLDPQAPSAPQAPDAPYVDQAAIDRQTRDLARRRKGVAANQIAGDTGPGTVATAVLGGG